jgi:hypothetical protein
MISARRGTNEDSGRSGIRRLLSPEWPVPRQEAVRPGRSPVLADAVNSWEEGGVAGPTVRPDEIGRLLGRIAGP